MPKPYFPPNSGGPDGAAGGGGSTPQTFQTMMQNLNCTGASSFSSCQYRESNYSCYTSDDIFIFCNKKMVFDVTLNASNAALVVTQQGNASSVPGVICSTETSYWFPDGEPDYYPSGGSGGASRSYPYPGDIPTMVTRTELAQQYCRLLQQPYRGA